MTLSKFIFRQQEPELSVRTVIGTDGEPWFIAADVCSILEIGNARQAVARLDAEEVTVISNDGATNGHTLNAVNESGLYSLILGSRKPEAKAFKKWITSEVLPAIRKTGSYSLAKPPTYAESLRLAADAIERAERLELQALADRPKVEFFDAVAKTDDAILIGDFGKMLGYGTVRFFELLRNDGILYKRGGYNLPYQKHIEAGHFKVVETTREGSEGTTHVQFTTRVLAKGQDYLRKKYAPVGALN